MKLTKYEHACVVLEENGKKLVIDPGSYAESLPELDHVVAVVVTHQHGDHLDEARLKMIMDKNPEAQIFTTADTAEKLMDYTTHIVHNGDELSVGPFRLRFFGELHAEVHRTIPRPQNVAVLVNDTLYFPGDSFTLPNVPVQALLAPASGPWLKLGETVDFIEAVKPVMAIPTHDGFYSKDARAFAASWLQGFCEKFNVTITALEAGESVEI